MEKKTMNEILDRKITALSLVVERLDRLLEKLEDKIKTAMQIHKSQIEKIEKKLDSQVAINSQFSSRIEQVEPKKKGNKNG